MKTSLRNWIGLLATVAVLGLAACDDASNSTSEASMGAAPGGMGGMVMSKKMMAAPAAAPMVADAMMVAPAPEGRSASVDYAEPPSSMVLDRSQFGDRKIAETHSMSIETTYDTLQKRYQRDFKKCVEMGCQIENSSIQLEENAYIAAKIAPEKLGAFLDFLAEGEGKILNHQVSADDQTMQYSDTVAHTENLMALRERLRTLLNSDKAKDVEGILSIENELNRVQTEIDSNTSQLKILQKMTQLATVNLSYSVQYRPSEVEPYTLKNTLKMATQKFLYAVDRMIQFVGGALPWIPVLFVGFWLAVRVVRFAFARMGGAIKWPWRKG